MYSCQGCTVCVMSADHEFAPLQVIHSHLSFNFTSWNEDVPEIERYIRTIKDQVRSCCNVLPFKRIPQVVLVENAVFWINAFPPKDSMSASLSPGYIITRRHLDVMKHVRCEFGSYVQTHEEHTSDMRAHTTSAICLGPSGNK
jgi:hypothetical protein